ncbi:MAG: zinc ribbon domain-containing protein [Candidatus Bathyarchaeota archaeon]|nr:zinc ribbon domain-containing protein [Candidatus Bathyarchaeota archaeon]
MSGFFDKVKSGAGKVAFEADKVGDVKKAQFDIMNLKKQIEGSYTKLGEMSYRRYVATGQEAPEFAEVCQAIVQVEQKIAAKEEEIKQINARVYQSATPQQTYSAPPTTYAPPPSYSAPQQQYNAPPPPPPQQGGKFCPSCGTPVNDTTKFCSNCGAKVA